MTQQSIYWYDFETFGKDPRRDRASQFAGIRTDLELNIISDPLLLFCQPAADFLPDPMACLITGITPQRAGSEGVPEAEFIRQIHAEFSQPGTCVAGYNSLRFDDEMTRQLLYRNFYDPYEREWKHGNSRWDIIDMLRMCAALRPEGINWPIRADGGRSFRLEQLTVANGIEHANAHDALADVVATIEMAKLVKTKQPRLYDYLWKLRAKKEVVKQLNLTNPGPLLHTSMMYPAQQCCTAIVGPLCQHPTNSNSVIVYDLAEDPQAWMDLSVEQIARRVFTANDDLPAGEKRIGLKEIHLNRCPVIAPLSVLPDNTADWLAVSPDQARVHWSSLEQASELKSKLQRVFAAPDYAQESDPDYMIYSGGFFSGDDKKRMEQLRASSPEQLASFAGSFQDPRLDTLLLRYRARNYPTTLSAAEMQQWESHRIERISSEAARNAYEQGLVEATERAVDDKDRGVLADLDDYVRDLL